MDMSPRRSVARLDADRDVRLHAARARRGACQEVQKGAAPHEAEASPERPEAMKKDRKPKPGDVIYDSGWGDDPALGAPHQVRWTTIHVPPASRARRFWWWICDRIR